MKRAARKRDRWVARRRVLVAALGAAGVLVLGRAFQLQALEGDRWAQMAAEQQQSRAPLPARRGGIYDRDGVPLALSAETFGIAVAPRELKNPRATATRLVRALGISTSDARRATDRRRRWVVLPGRFRAEQRAQLAGIRGIHFERKLERIYPHGDMGREVLGRISGDGRPLGGIEQELDSILRGEPGWSVQRRDARGNVLPAVSLPVVAPTDGSDVYLTLDLELQEIADNALVHAMDSTGASGGDLLLVDPRTGEVLAAASRRPGGDRSAAAFTEPYEPGSTMKPFFVANLLASGKASLNEGVYAELGTWTAPGDRVIRDIHPYETLSLADGLRVSSNIAMVKLAPRLSPGEQFTGLRAFGFGSPTGIEYPAEAAGRLRRPGGWTPHSPGSLAMGYEMSATPLQMVMGYAALANGGILLEPHLVREVRDTDGSVVRRAEPRPIRRAIPAAVADQIRDVLVSVVEGGTATQASLTTFQVAGKTGTARRTGAGGRYVRGSYTASFGGFFPARQPQFALFVKLDEPQGQYYGGLTAAPVTRETLQGILAARSSPSLDRSALLETQKGASPAVRTARTPAVRTVAVTHADTPSVLLLENGPPTPPAVAVARPILAPDLAGLPLRAAIRKAHSRGLQVRIRGSGIVRTTSPEAGALLRTGDTILISAES